MSEDNHSTIGLEKPFWLTPPWAILFDLMKLHRVRPWDVNLSYLLTTLIREIGKKGYIDFKASGIALLSSAKIYKLKSELILNLQEPPKPLIERPIEFIPPPIQLPYRFEYTSTTINNLIEALENALEVEPFLETKPKLIPITPVPTITQKIDQFMIQIEDRIEELYQTILSFAKKEEVIPLSKLNKGLSKLEIIRTFILILFIACRGKIQLWQEKEFGEIYISVPAWLAG